ncbi:unnamed protein product, partial [Nesidiocoris tenuis]
MFSNYDLTPTENDEFRLNNHMVPAIMQRHQETCNRYFEKTWTRFRKKFFEEIGKCLSFSDSRTIARRKNRKHRIPEK